MGERLVIRANGVVPMLFVYTFLVLRGNASISVDVPFVVNGVGIFVMRVLKGHVGIINMVAITLLITRKDDVI